ncbi:mitochondrial 50S ribosomal protein L51, putative [Pediculus humanus corporis]|uniref:Large ribosomal subunit protein mL51 n=1 Tax=Pediculus humanus subsp. corporis TaxID=121224 RepID=E0VUP5_PEDHC|nr:mitochondrial 50S ribosomal protein L51, putative [Pediculus humanus corporis]EEB17101.1 mitochondrial 50S ribosomal protein L51, putative [Pediculus humanus corporis]
MSGLIKSFVNTTFKTISQLNYVPVRHRYYAEKIAKGPTVSKFGYKDKVERRGLLGRLKYSDKVHGMTYKPGNSWTKEKATFGQNDYIDILGDFKLKSFQVKYDVPKWLRGVKGNEFQLLTLKKKVYQGTKFQHEFPEKWTSLNKRINYLYKYLNKRTPTKFSNK